MLVATRPHLYTAISPAIPRRSNSQLQKQIEVTKGSFGTQQRMTRGCQSDVLHKRELVGNNPEQRNWKGIFIAVLVILIVCGCVVLAVVLLSEDEELIMLAKVRLSDVIDETWKDELASEARWVSGSLVMKDLHGNVRQMISPSLEGILLIPNTTMENLGIVQFDISGDFCYALLAYNMRQVNHYLYTASYIIYDIKTRSRRLLLHKNSVEIFQHASFGPRGSQLIYIVGGDIYYQKSVSTPAKNLTDDHLEDLIINGIANWQYEEQVLKRSRAHWFSPNGQYIAYAKFDDRNVPEAYVTAYSNDGPSRQAPYVYPRLESYRYAKAGNPNTVVKVHVVDLLSEQNVALTRPLLNRKRLDVLHAIGWSSDSQTILITWSNRTQSVSVTQQCSPDLSTCVDDILHLEPHTSQTNGWIPYMNQPYMFSNEPGVFFYIISRKQGGRSSFRHLAMVNYTEKPPVVEYLTDGSWEVTKLLHYSPGSKSVYYISNEKHPNTRHVYRVSLRSSDRLCLTCCQSSDLSNNILMQETTILKKVDTDCCLYYDAEFGTSSDWFLLHCLGPGVPYTAIGSLPTNQSVSAMPSKNIPISFMDRTLSFAPLGASPSLSSDYSNTVMRMYRYGTVNVKDKTINVKMLLPKEEHISHVPVIFQVGDLGKQNVDFRFRLDFPEYFVSSDKLVFVFIDGSGSGNRGDEILQSVYEQPGVLETEDIQAVLKHMTVSWNIIASRVGIIGTGYGGYVSLSAIMDPLINVNCGVAISPIVDWSLHSSFESEKLLGTPSANPTNYRKSTLLKRVNSMRGRNLLVFQGMKDKTINQQHAVLLQQTAINNNLPLTALQTIYYADQNHGLTNKKAKEAMYKAARSFLFNCLVGDFDVDKTEQH